MLKIGYVNRHRYFHSESNGFLIPGTVFQISGTNSEEMNIDYGADQVQIKEFQVLVNRE